jgi:serine/threonine protein kinase
MGVVYLGRDPRLDRSVAIKIVPAALGLNPENLARFEREAKLLAAVNHPNIASIYAVDEADGQSDDELRSYGVVLNWLGSVKGKLPKG